MNVDEIKTLLDAELNDCEIYVEGEGNHLSVTVIGEIFAGKRAVQRQQQVYAVLKDQIAAGTVHAVNLKTYTPAEWKAA